MGDAARTSPPVDVPTPYEPTAGNTTRGESLAPVTTATGVPAAAIPGPGLMSRAPADSPADALVSRHWSWAELLQRVFAADVLACPRCGGHMRVIATIDDPLVVRRILAHLGVLDDDGPPPGPRPCQAA